MKRSVVSFAILILLFVGFTSGASADGCVTSRQYTSYNTEYFEITNRCDRVAYIVGCSVQTDYDGSSIKSRKSFKTMKASGVSYTLNAIMHGDDWRIRWHYAASTSDWPQYPQACR